MMNKKENINQTQIDDLNKLIEKIFQILSNLLPKVHDINKQEIGDLIEIEMQKTSEAIEDAVSKLEVNFKET